MKMYLGGEWVERDQTVSVLNPYDGTTIDTVPQAGVEDVALAVKSAERGFQAMKAITAFDRYTILMKTVDLIRERHEEFARTLSAEEGKVINEARTEVDRCIQTITWSAEEAKRLGGETIPLDASPGNATKFGFTLRVPVGVVVAISPFNFPLNLVAHKVGPALAAGNSVIIKPASDTPLSALKLTEVLLEAGIPAEAIQCVTGPGGAIGDALVQHPSVRKVTFTGSQEVGEHIMRTAGLKKITMELGSNSPLVVMPDADVDKVAAATVAGGYSNAGQVCISTQRVIVDTEIYGDYLDALKPLVEAIPTGNPAEESVALGPMIRERDAVRVGEWIDEAAAGGATVLAGGERDGAMLSAAIIADVQSDMRVYREELFGPAVTVTKASGVDEAIEMANDTRFGLAAAIFTQNLDTAMRFALEVDSGNLNINWNTTFRADMMPYGGLKDSGLGKEGPPYAIEEMTELKMVIFHR
ncbi:MAG: aldehyde dehydrogenase family protein [Chloroflexi bacterium]|nr:aldehyde dehydrogenase family protein [Chloroflexota bacterium]